MKYRERVMATGARFVGFTQAQDYDDTNLNATFPDRARLKGLAQFRWDITNRFSRPYRRMSPMWRPSSLTSRLMS